MTTTEKLLRELNAARGLDYPAKGYTYFADVHGDGRANRKRIYTIINDAGGVTFSDLNDISAKRRCENIRRAIERARRERDGITLARDPARPWFPA